MEVKQAGCESLAMDGKCKNGARKFNTPFVLARHLTHRILDGHNGFMYIRIVEGEHQGMQYKL